MIKAKFGNCSKCNSTDILLYRRNPPECKVCYFKGKMERKKLSTNKPKPQPKKSILPVSKKRMEELAKYRPLRDKYLQDNPMCEVDDCNNVSTNLHHKAGRNGSLLYDVRYFMACCDDCHPRRIHENPEWARENGYIITVDNK